MRILVIRYGSLGHLIFREADKFLKGHRAGTISMANISEKHNGSQFIIHMTDNHFMDGSSVVFGEFFKHNSYY